MTPNRHRLMEEGQTFEEAEAILEVQADEKRREVQDRALEEIKPTKETENVH
jgi:hypothetical protein